MTVGQILASSDILRFLAEINKEASAVLLMLIFAMDIVLFYQLGDYGRYWRLGYGGQLLAAFFWFGTLFVVDNMAMPTVEQVGRMAFLFAIFITRSQAVYNIYKGTVSRQPNQEINDKYAAGIMIRMVSGLIIAGICIGLYFGFAVFKRVDAERKLVNREVQQTNQIRAEIKDVVYDIKSSVEEIHKETQGTKDAVLLNRQVTLKGTKEAAQAAEAAKLEAKRVRRQLAAKEREELRSMKVEKAKQKPAPNPSLYDIIKKKLGVSANETLPINPSSGQVDRLYGQEENPMPLPSHPVARRDDR